MRVESWEGIHDVWASNLEGAFKDIRQIVQKFPYIGFDTEFPGVVAMPIGEFRSVGEYQYQILRCNVDLLKMIQLGLTFFDERGNPKATWQFNFRFSLKDDMFAQDSIDLLVNSGIIFDRHAEEGIDPFDFAQLLITSGVVLSDCVHWLCFHAGYDFGYLLKILTEDKIPDNEQDFFELLRIYFPTIYDIKFLMKSCKSLKGGLQEVADQLKLVRIGPQHTAGSDSLLTGAAFFKMREDGLVTNELLPKSKNSLVYKRVEMRDRGAIIVRDGQGDTLKIEFAEGCSRPQYVDN